MSTLPPCDCGHSLHVGRCGVPIAWNLSGPNERTHDCRCTHQTLVAFFALPPSVVAVLEACDKGSYESVDVATTAWRCAGRPGLVAGAEGEKMSEICACGKPKWDPIHRQNASGGLTWHAFAPAAPASWQEVAVAALGESAARADAGSVSGCQPRHALECEYVLGDACVCGLNALRAEVERLKGEQEIAENELDDYESDGVAHARILNTFKEQVERLTKDRDEQERRADLLLVDLGGARDRMTERADTAEARAEAAEQRVRVLTEALEFYARRGRVLGAHARAALRPDAATAAGKP